MFFEDKLHFILPKLKIAVEHWKYNDEYKIYVSNLGNFKNNDKKDITFCVNKNGYLTVPTYKGWHTAHRLVLLTWKPIENAEFLTVDHLNHNKRDNSLNNLEWVTKEENYKRSIRDRYKKNKKSTSNIKYCYKAGKNCFDSLEEAAKWVLESNGAKDLTGLKTVESKILHAVDDDVIYANYKWRYVAVE